MSHVFAVDIGGSAIKLGLIDTSGNVTAKDAFELASINSLDELVQHTAERLFRLSRSQKVSPASIGISAPGHSDRVTGQATDGTGNVPSLKEGSFPARLSQLTGLCSSIENDGICATLGELEYGAGRNASNFALITMGTGIGGALVIDRRIVTGSGGKPPEIGAMVLEPNHQIRRHGLRGTFEDLAGGKAIINLYASHTGEPVQSLDVDTIRQRALQGDTKALQAFDTMARYIAQAFGTMINMTAIDLCIVGGGISLSGDFLLKRIRGFLPQNTWPYLAKDVKIIATQHGNESGLIGAAAMIQRRKHHLPRDNNSIFYPADQYYSDGE